MLPGTSAFGNFRGVMLCDRAIAAGENANCANVTGSKYSHATATVDRRRGGADGYFVCGIVQRPLGCCTDPRTGGTTVRRRQQQHQQHPTRRTNGKTSGVDSMMSRHRRWLHRLRRERERSEKEAEVRRGKREDERKQFMEREARHRARIVGFTGTMGSVTDMEEDADSNAHLNEISSEFSEVHVDSSFASAKVNNDVQKSQLHQHEQLIGRNERDKTSKVCNRPMWALTKKEALESEEKKEQNEEEDLLKFVDSLDYEKYASDLELTALIDQIKNRIAHLERQKEKEDTLNKLVEEEKSSSRLDVCPVPRDDAEQQGTVPPEKNSELRSVAGTLISSGGMGWIHSLKSAEALVKKKLDKSFSSSYKSDTVRMCASHENLAVVAAHEEKVTFSSPISVVHPAEGFRLSQKVDLNKLPFKNRNPAV